MDEHTIDPRSQVDPYEPQPRPKPAKKRGRALKVVGVLVAVVVALVGVYLAAGLVAAGVYWGNAYDGVEDADVLDAYEEDVLVLFDVWAVQEEVMFANTDMATEVSSDYDELFATCDEYIVTYFSEVWGLDVADLVDSIQVWEFDFCALEGEYEGAYGTYYLDYVGIGGQEDPDYGNIYLSVELFEEGGLWSDDEDWLVEVYIHEVIHDLGVCAQLDNEMTFLYEGMCEYLTGCVLTYAGVDYTNSSAYSYNSTIGGQLIEADDELVVAMVGNYGEFRLDEWIDERLGEEGCAEELDDLLCLLIYGGYDSSDLLLRAQHLAAEYCKAVNADEAQDVVDGNEVVGNFELSCLLNGWS